MHETGRDRMKIKRRERESVEETAKCVTRGGELWMWQKKKERE